MRRCGFFGIFTGIETPDPEALLSVNKKQNVGRDIASNIFKIYQAGIFVNAGFIIGFDAEKESVAQEMIRCIEELAIPVCMVGLLYALPDTQLSRRLQQEGRLHPDSGRVGNDDSADQCTSGLNFDTLRPRLEILQDYRTVLNSIYHPVNFFGRVRRNARALQPVRDRLANQVPRIIGDIRSFIRISWRLGVRDREVRGPYWKALADCIFHNPKALRTVVSFAALYLHMRPFAGFMAGRLQSQIEGLSFSEPSLHVPLARGMEA